MNDLDPIHGDDAPSEADGVSLADLAAARRIADEAFRGFAPPPDESVH
jgi:hypothetical protein